MNTRNDELVTKIAQEFIADNECIRQAFTRNGLPRNFVKGEIWGLVFGKMMFKNLRPETLGRIISTGEDSSIGQIINELLFRAVGMNLLLWHASAIIIERIWGILESERLLSYSFTNLHA